MAKRGSTESKPLIITLVFVILALIGVSIYLYILIGEREQYRSEKAKADEDLNKEKEVTAYHKFTTRLLKSYLVDVNDDTKKKIDSDKESFKNHKLGGSDPERADIEALMTKFDPDPTFQKNDVGDNLYGKDDLALKNLMPKKTDILTRNWGKDPARGIDLTTVDKNFSAEVIALRDALAAKQAEIVGLTSERNDLTLKLAAKTKELADEKQAQSAALAGQTAKGNESLAKSEQRVGDIDKKNLESQAEVNKAREETQKVRKEVADLQVALAGVKNELELAKKRKDTGAEDLLRFEKPRGEVIEIQRGGNVILKLVSTKNLEPGATFSVRGVNQQGKPLENAKGNLKVTEIGQSYCVATVVDQKDSFHDPITKGDKVFSLSWDPEQQKHVVLVGVMDAGGPGTFNYAEATRQMLDLKHNVERQGMVVDGYMDMNTFKIVEGKISVDTDYLIEGRVIDSQKPKEGDVKNMGEAVSEARKEALRDGVLIIPLRRFMAMSGSPLPNPPKETTP